MVWLNLDEAIMCPFFRQMGFYERIKQHDMNQYRIVLDAKAKKELFAKMAGKKVMSFSFQSGRSWCLAVLTAVDFLLVISYKELRLTSIQLYLNPSGTLSNSG